MMTFDRANQCQRKRDDSPFNEDDRVTSYKMFVWPLFLFNLIIWILMYLAIDYLQQKP